MPTKAEIAKDWGVSASYVTRCCNRGCPTGSLDTAREWRELNARGKRSGVRNAMGEESGQGRRTDLEPPSERPKREIKRREATGDPMLDALNKSLDAFDEANTLLIEAMSTGHVARISALLSIHNKSLQAQFDAQRLYREELERRKQLIHIEDAKLIARRGWDKLLPRMRALPNKMAAQVSKDDPILAFSLLEKECSEIIAEAAREYET